MATVTVSKANFMVEVLKKANVAMPTIITAQNSIQTALASNPYTIKTDSGVVRETNKLLISVGVTYEGELKTLLNTAMTAIEAITNGIYTVTTVTGLTRQVEQ